jgi:erythromycin esterase-like protein
LHRRRAEYASRDRRVAADEFLVAEQHARLVLNAEESYRTMFTGRVASWNLRDRHMTDTLRELLVVFLDRTRPGSRLVVWAHNSHLGDARATEMGDGGELNVGQEQLDYILHFDTTRAVEPLERSALWEPGEVAETFPSGL